MAARKRSGFLPSSVTGYFSRRAIDALALSCVTAATLMAAAVLSFHPADPSLNQAIAGPVANLLGRPGAVTADLLLQFFGLAAALPIFVLLAWGIRILLGHTLSHVHRRVFLLILGMIALTAGLSVFSLPADTPYVSAAGGALGLVLQPVLERVSTAFSLPLLPLATATISLAVIVLLYVLAITPGEWRRAGDIATNVGLVGARGAHKTALVTGRAAVVGARGARRGAGFLRRHVERARNEPRLARAVAVAKPAARNAVKTAAADAEQTPRRRAPLVETRPPATPPVAAARVHQPRLDLPVPSGEYELPPLDLLTPAKDHGAERRQVNEEALEANARLLESVLEDFGIRGEIVKVRPGPVVTLYELEPAPGTKTSRVISLADDIARSMSAVSVRIAVVPGRNVIGIELPNARREMVSLQELLASPEFEKSQGTLTMALGKDIGGTPSLVDLARMPHLLIAGTTGSGKSVGLNAMIVSLLYRLRPDQCRFIMIDPKMLELSVYDGIPHLLAPVVTEPKKAVVALKWVVREMENRYQAMSKLGVRNIAGYNQRLDQARKRGEVIQRTVQTGFDTETGKPVIEQQPLDTTALPYIVVIVDEMADLMLVAGKDVEAAIQRLAQMARAAGIHLIMATQRPSVDVVTGTIKANFPTRISFQVTTKIDSRTILSEQGAEQLLGMGDMLHMTGGGRIVRVHGPFVSDTEVEDIVAFLKRQGTPEYLDDVTDDDEDADGSPGYEVSDASFGGATIDDKASLYDHAVALVTREQRASTSFIQRHLQIGYNRAATIIEQLEKEGVVSQANHVGKREVLAPPPPEL